MMIDSFRVIQLGWRGMGTAGWPVHTYFSPVLARLSAIGLQSLFKIASYIAMNVYLLQHRRPMYI